MWRTEELEIELSAENGAVIPETLVDGMVLSDGRQVIRIEVLWVDELLGDIQKCFDIIDPNSTRLPETGDIYGVNDKNYDEWLTVDVAFDQDKDEIQIIGFDGNHINTDVGVSAQYSLENYRQMFDCENLKLAWNTGWDTGVDETDTSKGALNEIVLSSPAFTIRAVDIVYPEGEYEEYDTDVILLGPTGERINYRKDDSISFIVSFSFRENSCQVVAFDGYDTGVE